MDITVAKAAMKSLHTWRTYETDEGEQPGSN